MCILRGIDGPITFADNRNAPELRCCLSNQFIVEGDPSVLYGRGNYRNTREAEAVRPGWRHADELAVDELRAQDVHTENVRRIAALWRSGHNRERAQGVAWPYDGSSVIVNAVLWFHREKAAEAVRQEEYDRAREAARKWQAERELGIRRSSRLR
ncbi:hypothetical protein ACIRG5_38760 [Lentzea sp. NPDC102401]|uniref:hypothetical protein n=1 Tax=Lentzea sp. NPDC102401 TaxID=3364128 RepID=UPI00380C13B9